VISIGVRLASEADLDALMGMLHDCIVAMRAAGIDQWDDIYPNRERMLADATTQTLYLGFMDDALAGALVLNDHQDAQWADVPWSIRDVPVAVVHRLMVAPDWQGRGVARALMAFAERHARGSGYGAIRLDAFSANPVALRLYHGLGYRDAGGATFRKGPFRCFEKRLQFDPAANPEASRKESSSINGRPP
jgi:GNAT superfamily N-acetyltransferase